MTNRGPKQRCWAHLLRDIHDLRTLYPQDHRLAQWPDAVHQLYRQSTACTHPSQRQRRTAQLALERRLLALCRPYLDDPSAVQARLCRRIENHIKELFVFVGQPEVPPDNNAAERSLRPVVISRKISGGTRSIQGTDTKMTLASIFGTWRAQGFNTLTTCRRLLASPKSCMLNEDFTEVEWVGQTDQVLVIKDRCSARVAAPVPKEPEQLPGPNRARIVQERASTPLGLHRRPAWGKQEST